MSEKLDLILLVDDDASSNYLTSEMINATRLVEETIYKYSAKEALEYLESAKKNDKWPELIFLDLNMPGLNGWDFVEKYHDIIKQAPNHCCEIVVLTSSFSTKDLIKGSVHPEVLYYLNKPLEMDELRNLLREKIERKELAP